MNEKQRLGLSKAMKLKWKDPVFREMSLKARRVREVREFLLCGRRYWSEAHQATIKCRNDRHRDAKMCNKCLDRIEEQRENRIFKHRKRQTLFPWKWNGKRLELGNGEYIDVPEDHLFLDLSL